MLRGGGARILLLLLLLLLLRLLMPRSVNERALARPGIEELTVTGAKRLELRGLYGGRRSEGGLFSEAEARVGRTVERKGAWLARTWTLVGRLREDGSACLGTAASTGAATVGVGVAGEGVVRNVGPGVGMTGLAGTPVSSAGRLDRIGKRMGTAELRRGTFGSDVRREDSWFNALTE